MNDWISQLIENWGYLAVGFLMFVETVFPPIPSEVIMTVAGVHVAQQGGSVAGIVLSGTAGAMAGNIFWFALAWKLGLDRFEGFLVRHGRIFTMDEREIARGRALFHRYGAGLVGVGRIIPSMRSLISVPAGLVRMRWRTFLIFSTLGTFLWTLGLALAGYYLGRNFAAIDKVLGPLSTLVIAVFFGIYLYRVLMWNRWKRRETLRKD